MRTILLMSSVVLVALASAWAGDPALGRRVKANYTPEDARTILDALLDIESKGFPLGVFENKVREGVAKKRSAGDIVAALSHRSGSVDVIVKEYGGKVPDDLDRRLLAVERSENARIPVEARSPEVPESPIGLAEPPAQIDKHVPSAPPDLGGARSAEAAEKTARIESDLSRKQAKTLEKLEKKQLNMERKANRGKKTD